MNQNCLYLSIFFTFQAYFVDSLIKAYRLTDHMDVFRVKLSSYDDLIEFHSSAYIDFLKNANDGNSSLLEAENEHGIGKYIKIILDSWLKK